MCPTPSQYRKRPSEAKSRQHAAEVNNLYGRFMAFFRQMPVRFDRTEEPKKGEKSEPKPPAKEP